MSTQASLETVEITDMAFGGKGVGRLANGKAVFVPFVIPGERAQVSLWREKKTYAEGVLERLLERSPDRVEPPCPLFGRCGGCSYQHISYPRQLAIKTAQVRSHFRRVGGLTDSPVADCLPAPMPLGYRNRISVHVDRGTIGFVDISGAKLVDVPECLLASGEVNRQLSELRNGRPAPGRLTLREPSMLRGFRQTNDAVAAQLLELVADALDDGGDLLIDAYCGAGFFAKRLRERFARVVGIEWSASALGTAAAEVLPGERYLCGDVSEFLPEALASREIGGSVTLILDPPSEGLGAEVTAAILANPPERIVYVSCNPPTAARDIGKMAAGYRLTSVTPLDMFPQTAEIEMAAFLERL